MEIIGAFEAKMRLSELLERTEQGETFQITRHGRPVGKLVPPNTVRNRQVIEAAAQRLKGYRRLFGDTTKDQLIALKHEEHR